MESVAMAEWARRAAEAIGLPGVAFTVTAEGDMPFLVIRAEVKYAATFHVDQARLQSANDDVSGEIIDALRRRLLLQIAEAHAALGDVRQ